MKQDRAIRTPGELVEAGLAPASRLPELQRVAARYAVAITPAVAGLIDRDDPDDPIARQFVPDLAELTVTPDERADPIGDLTHSPVEGIVHRYPDRVLLKAVHVCPVYCRFCFRREMVGPEGLGTLTPEQMDAAIGYIRAHTEIWEVILTGGDPLVLSARRLREMMARLSDIEHVKVVRFHTRVPVVEPERVDDEAGRGAQGVRQGDVSGGARQPSARADRRGAGGDRADGRCRHRAAEPDGAVARRQR